MSVTRLRQLLRAVTVLWVLQAGHGLEGGSQSQVEALHPVCWRSTEHGGHSGENLQGISESNPGVSVFGSGCSSCVVGEICSFTISVLAPASWTAPPHVSQRRELNVIITGPALHAGLIQPVAVDDSSFLVTYRIWDAGPYRMSLRSSCGSLNYTTGDEQTRPHEMASWELVVHPVAEQGRREARQGQEEEDEKGKGKGQEGIASSVEKQPNPASLSSPCTSRKFGRWLLHEDGKYRWTPFPCTQKKAMDPSQWVTALNKAGVKEINLLGDSHQRVLTLHLRYLLIGQLDPKHRFVHESFSYDIQSPDGTGQLRLNFNWISGIYTATPQSGCSQEGRNNKEPQWPQVSEAADVWVVEAGYWTGSHCKRPEAALAASLPNFLTWTKGRVEAAAGNSVQESQQKREPLFVYRPTPPRPSEELGCGGLLTNKYVRAANSIERVLIPHFGALLLDSWEIEAARFTDNCRNDHHYSCMTEEQPGKHSVTGDVGEADAFALVHFILNN